MMEYHQGNHIQEEEERMIPCQYYVNGFCVQGGRCRFYHPAAGQINNAIRVPAMPVDFGSPAALRQSPQFRTNATVSPPRASFAFHNTPRPTDCHFGQEPDITMVSAPISPVRNTEIRARSKQRSARNSGEDAEVQQRFLPHGITSTTKNGLVSYTYPNQERRTPPRVPRTSERQADEGQATMFTHINWNDFLIPGFSPPPLVNVPLEDIESHEFQEGGAVDGSSSGSQIGDIPPEGSSSSKMSAKEEFHLKVRMIAMASAEPVAQVRSLDSFFRNYGNLESLPLEMLERKKTIPKGKGSESSETSETKSLPELEEGELEESDYEQGPHDSSDHSDDPDHTNEGVKTGGVAGKAC